jgi:hypothetical protein
MHEIAPILDQAEHHYGRKDNQQSAPGAKLAANQMERIAPIYLFKRL